MTAPITHHAHTAAALLARAESIGLPLPNSVRVSKLGVHLGLSTLADLTDWVAWLEAPPIESTPVRDHDTRLAHRAEAVVDGVEVTVWHVSVAAGSAPTCRACNGKGKRLHGYALCPKACEDCGGTGRVAAGSAA